MRFTGERHTISNASSTKRPSGDGNAVRSLVVWNNELNADGSVLVFGFHLLRSNSTHSKKPHAPDTRSLASSWKIWHNVRIMRCGWPTTSSDNLFFSAPCFWCWFLSKFAAYTLVFHFCGSPYTSLNLEKYCRNISLTSLSVLYTSDIPVRDPSSLDRLITCEVSELSVVCLLCCSGMSLSASVESCLSLVSCSNALSTVISNCSQSCFKATPMLSSLYICVYVCATTE